MKNISVALFLNLFFLNILIVSQIIGPMGGAILFFYTGPIYFFLVLPLAFSVFMFSFVITIKERKQFMFSSMLLFSISLFCFLIISTGFYWSYTVPNKITISILLAMNSLIIMNFLIVFRKYIKDKR